MGQLKYMSILVIWNEMVENCQLHTLATFICTFHVEGGELYRP